MINQHKLKNRTWFENFITLVFQTYQNNSQVFDNFIKRKLSFGKQIGKLTQSTDSWVWKIEIKLYGIGLLFKCILCDIFYL